MVSSATLDGPHRATSIAEQEEQINSLQKNALAYKGEWGKMCQRVNPVLQNVHNFCHTTIYLGLSHATVCIPKLK